MFLLLSIHDQVNIILFILFLIIIFSQILDSESNLKPIWLTQLECSVSDSSLPACVSDTNVVGFADCQRYDIAAVDCGK